MKLIVRRYSKNFRARFVAVVVLVDSRSVALSAGNLQKTSGKDNPIEHLIVFVVIPDVVMVFSCPDDNNIVIILCIIATVLYGMVISIDCFAERMWVSKDVRMDDIGTYLFLDVARCFSTLDYVEVVMIRNENLYRVLVGYFDTCTAPIFYGVFVVLINDNFIFELTSNVGKTEDLGRPLLSGKNRRFVILNMKLSFGKINVY